MIPKSISLLHNFHIGFIFCLFPANLMYENDLFSRCTQRHSQLETFSQPYFNQIAFPLTVLPKDDRTDDFFQEERLDLPYWTVGSSILDHDSGHLCRGGRIQMFGHSDLGIFQ